MNGASLATTADTSVADATLSEERLFDLLGNERRRSCLQCLTDLEGTIAVQDLATRVAERVSDDETSPSAIRDSVYISLCQNHLPKLHDAGVVEYDSEAKTARRGPTFPAVERHLQVDAADPADGDETPYYLLASVVTVFVLAIATYAVPGTLPYAVPALLVLHSGAALAMSWRAV